MDPLPSDFEKSMRRSRDRRETFLALSALGEAYVEALARHTGLRWQRVHGVLVGDPPRYRTERSLVALGLADVVRGRDGVAYRITSRGRWEARRMEATRARRRRVSGRRGGDS